jgi:uncharacterized protein (DUF1800 family)
MKCTIAIALHACLRWVGDMMATQEDVLSCENKIFQKPLHAPSAFPQSSDDSKNLADAERTASRIQLSQQTKR